MDINILAKSIVDQAIGEKAIKKPKPETAKRGLARAAMLTPERRSEIASTAAAKRWAKKEPRDEYSS